MEARMSHPPWTKSKRSRYCELLRNGNQKGAPCSQGWWLIKPFLDCTSHLNVGLLEARHCQTVTSAMRTWLSFARNCSMYLKACCRVRYPQEHLSTVAPKSARLGTVLVHPFPCIITSAIAFLIPNQDAVLQLRRKLCVQYCCGG